MGEAMMEDKWPTLRERLQTQYRQINRQDARDIVEEIDDLRKDNERLREVLSCIAKDEFDCPHADEACDALKDSGSE